MKYKLLHKPYFDATYSLYEALINVNDSLNAFQNDATARANNSFCGHVSSLEKHLVFKELYDGNNTEIDGV